MTHDEMIAVIEAHKRGDELQWRYLSLSVDWKDCLNPQFDFARAEYRIKPQPDIVWRYDYQYEEGGPLHPSFYTEDDLRRQRERGHEPGSGKYFKGRVKYVREVMPE